MLRYLSKSKNCVTVKTLLIEIIIDRSHYVPAMLTMEVITIGTRMLGIAGGIKAYITIGTRMLGIAGGIKAYITIGTRMLGIAGGIKAYITIGTRMLGIAVALKPT